MTTKAELRKLTVEEIEEYQKDLMKQQAELRKEQARVQEVYDEMFGEAEAERRLLAMSEPEREALATYLQTKGLPSEEAVGDQAES